MAWVSDKISENTVISTKIGALWNSLRDSIGDALTEFQLSVHNSGVSGKDCKARGRFCIRIEKNDSSIEVFLDLSHRLVKSGSLDLEEKTLCGYRLDAARQGLEFFAIQDALSSSPLSAEEVSRIALEEFLFTPFPTVLTAKAP
jgi:hypothetical protein